MLPKEEKKEPQEEFVRGFTTKAIHVGQEPDPENHAVVPPIYVSTTYEIYSEQPPKFIYSRSANPTRAILEKTLAALEKGKYCVCTSSGMGAVSIVYHLLHPGDHVVACDDLYGTITFYLTDFGKERQGVQIDTVDLRDVKNLQNSLKPNTKLVWIETPTNPTLNVVDIAAVAKICKEKGIMVAVDNTFSTPYLQNPLELGADIVIHSCTKYIGGHSDLMMGAAITNNEDMYKKMRKYVSVLGCCPSALDCFLAMRGLKTLSLRMERSQCSAMKLAELLEKHPKVAKTVYPGLKSHPGHEIMKKQAKGFGGIITLIMKSGTDATTFYKKLTLFGHAVSLGNVGSLVTIPLMATHSDVPLEIRTKLGIDETMVRLSIGIEEFDDLRDDIMKALDAIQPFFIYIIDTWIHKILSIDQ
eukprot:TRINITY_DN71097_c0_g1_i1.p3 TRINITY_DN71097_c0_g1~~TRINITY_DN71097_c0_g1_i1.p3  ORF type:complete len:415 (-),score=40.52 TRINITY_DN71097_c0_g1_i1:1762-3006(-)